MELEIARKTVTLFRFFETRKTVTLIYRNGTKCKNGVQRDNGLKQGDVVTLMWDTGNYFLLWKVSITMD